MWVLGLFGSWGPIYFALVHLKFCDFHGLLLSLCPGPFDAFRGLVRGNGVGLLACFRGIGAGDDTFGLVSETLLLTLKGL